VIHVGTDPLVLTEVEGVTNEGTSFCVGYERRKRALSERTEAIVRNGMRGGAVIHCHMCTLCPPKQE
jgi:hypothetical protein